MTAKKEAFLFLDGEKGYRLAPDAFMPMMPHHKGGIHPGITGDHQGYLHAAPNANLTGCPVKPVELTHDGDAPK